jgi:hypothetical protein
MNLEKRAHRATAWLVALFVAACAGNRSKDADESLWKTSDRRLRIPECCAGRRPSTTTTLVNRGTIARRKETNPVESSPTRCSSIGRRSSRRASSRSRGPPHARARGRKESALRREGPASRSRCGTGNLPSRNDGAAGTQPSPTIGGSTPLRIELTERAAVPAAIANG